MQSTNTAGTPGAETDRDRANRLEMRAMEQGIKILMLTTELDMTRSRLEQAYQAIGMHLVAEAVARSEAALSEPHPSAPIMHAIAVHQDRGQR